MRSRLFSSSTVVRTRYPPRISNFPITSIPAVQISTTLATLPPISTFGKVCPIRIRPSEDLEIELDSWRRACSISHRALRGELYCRRGHYKNSVVRIVANTMRLLMHLGHFRAAKELDRAFFTLEEEGESFIPESEENSYQIPDHYRLGNGLGYDRKGIQLAWIQSLSLRLESGLFEKEGEFGNLLQLLYQNEQEGVINLVTVSFLIRKLSFLRRITIAEGKEASQVEKKIGIERIEAMLKVLRGSQYGGEQMVLSADLESIIERYSSRSSRNHILESEEFAQLQRGVEGLVGNEMEYSQVDDLLKEMNQDRMIPPTDSFSPTTISTSPPPNSKLLLNRAHTLHLATQFLLLKAGLTAESLESTLERRIQVSHLLNSSIEIYYSLLEILPLIPPDLTDIIVQIRQRQLSSLYRILWASVGVFDIEHSPAVKYGLKESQEMSVEKPEFETILKIMEMILESKKVLNRLKPYNLISRDQTSQSGHISPQFLVDPRLLLISSNFFRRLIFSLCLPSVPSRSSPPLLPATKTPWSILEKTLSLVLECREYDSEIGLPYYLSGKKSIKESLMRRALIVNLVRATILGGGDHLEEEGSVESRLTFLLYWFEEMERFEKVDRKIVEAAIFLVLKQEWNGAAWGVWKANLRDITRNWVEQKRDEVGRVEQKKIEL